MFSCFKIKFWIIRSTWDWWNLIFKRPDEDDIKLWKAWFQIKLLSFENSSNRIKHTLHNHERMDRSQTTNLIFKLIPNINFFDLQTLNKIKACIAVNYVTHAAQSTRSSLTNNLKRLDYRNNVLYVLYVKK